MRKRNPKKPDLSPSPVLAAACWGLMEPLPLALGERALTQNDIPNGPQVFIRMGVLLDVLEEECPMHNFVILGGGPSGLWLKHSKSLPTAGVLHLTMAGAHTAYQKFIGG